MPVTERHTLTTVSEAIQGRREFICNTMRGWNDYRALYVGQLPRQFQAQYGAARLASDFFVIESYRTPISWFADGEWTMPNVTYSPTTSRHQSVVRKAIA